MSQEARVNSVFMLKQLRASLSTFAETAAMVLEEANMEMQRTRRWLSDDCYRHWRTQVQVRTEQVARAKIALKQKEVFDRTLAGTPSSCVDERKALKRADERLQEAQHKLDRVRLWSQRIEKELSDYRGATQRLVGAIEVDIPNARVRLDKMIDSLEAYFAVVPPQMPRTTTEPSEVDLTHHGAPPTENRAPVSSEMKEGAKSGQEPTPSPHRNQAP